MTVTDTVGLITGDRAILWHKRLSQEFGWCEAMLIQQVNFWCVTNPRSREGNDWCYNTYEAWADQVDYSTRQVKRAMKKLEEAKIVVSGCFNKNGYDRTRWYRVDRVALELRLAQPIKMSPAIVTPGHNHKCHQGTIKSDAMARPIPEMNTEMKTHSNSVVTDAAGEKPEQHQEHQEKQEQKQEQGKNNGEEMATAKDILEKQQKQNQNKHGLSAQWLHLKSLSTLHGGFQNALTMKEMSQLKQFGKLVMCKVDPISVVNYVFAEWWKFSQDARFSAGLSHAPTCPDCGFLLKHCEIAVNLYLQTIAKPVKIFPAHAPKIYVLPLPLKEEVYKPTPEQIAATLAEM
jgi:hypothetical protein